VQTILPLILVGLGSAALLVLRDGRFTLAALLVQWLGLAAVPLLSGGGATMPALVEIATALTCAVLLAVTWLDINSGFKGQRKRAPREEMAEGLSDIADDLWPLVIVVAAAIAGLVLARLYPLGGEEGQMVAFYWALLSGALVLILEGARDPVKLGAGLCALLNGVSLLFTTLPEGVAGPVTLGLLAICRIGLAIVLAQGWARLGSLYSRLSFMPLFDARGTAFPMSDMEDEAVLEGGTNEEEPEARDGLLMLGEGHGEELASAEGLGTGEEDEEDEEWLRRITRETEGQVTRGGNDG
jgi:hypothetical protein